MFSSSERCVVMFHPRGVSVAAMSLTSPHREKAQKAFNETIGIRVRATDGMRRPAPKVHDHVPAYHFFSRALAKVMSGPRVLTAPEIYNAVAHVRLDHHHTCPADRTACALIASLHSTQVPAGSNARPVLSLAQHANLDLQGKMTRATDRAGCLWEQH